MRKLWLLVAAGLVALAVNAGPIIAACKTLSGGKCPPCPLCP
jgi:hypothetical protein